MITTIIMFAILAVLGAITLVGCTKANKNDFFDINNTTVMRGVFSIIILLVHIPQAYSNRIQDMVGSFAYIGVTFFFMTSAYGLTLNVLKNNGSIKHFWGKRLYKLFLPMFLINIVFFVVTFIDSKQLDFSKLISINGWVAQLILFYLAFYLVFRFVKLSNTVKVILVSAFIVLFSLVAYFYAQHLPFSWAVEAFGFIYGLLLGLYREQVYTAFSKNYVVKLSLLVVLSLVCGLAYLKYKEVFFFGGYLTRILLSVFLIMLLLAINYRISFSNKASLFLGSISYEIYLMHPFVFEMISKHLPELESGVFILCGIVITVVLSIAVNYTSKLITSRIFKKAKA